MNSGDGDQSRAAASQGVATALQNGAAALQSVGAAALQGVSEVRFALNGAPRRARPDVGERLSETLRERLAAREVKVGCDAGDCGACTVLLDGAAVCACLTPAQQADGRQVETVAGLTATDPHGRRLAESFLDHGAAQCGICTPGMIVSAVALLRRDPAPDETAVMDALGGVLCRCTGYRKIIDAVRACASPAADPEATAATETAARPATDGAGGGGVGASPRRLDGRAKVSGGEAFGDDVAPADALALRIIRSPYPHAEFTLGDLDAWRAARPGIAATLTAADVPGRNCFGVIPNFADQPVFAERVARFRGEAVAAVVGAPAAIRGLDPESFPVEWRPLAAVETPAAALAEGAPLLHPTRARNVLHSGFVACGDAAAALAAAAVTVEGRFETGFVEHAYIEPEAGFARVVDGRVEVSACTQAPWMDLAALAEILDLAPDRLRIPPTAVGGGFGAKLDLSVQPYLALAALKTGRPVRLALSRRESMQSTTKRHPAEIQMKIGADRDGRLSGMIFSGTFNTGAYASWGPTVANRVPVHASGPYRVADYRAEARGVHTHAPPAGAFRGFGVPQASVALESLLDELADRLGRDPLEFRIANALRDGDATVCGQRFAQGVGIAACLKALRPAWAAQTAAAAAFNARADADAEAGIGAGAGAGAGEVRRGVGVAAGWYGCGNTSLPNPSTIRAGVRADGVVALHQGAVDIGQGANTVIAQIFASALGAPLEAITLIGADTDLTPDAGKTSASRQTFISGNAAFACGRSLRAAILRSVNAADGAALAFAPGAIMVSDAGARHVVDLRRRGVGADGYVFRAEETYDPPTAPLDANGQGAPYAQFGYAAQLAVVEVDLALGRARALRVVAAHDVGKAINPVLVEGQIHGGVAQGLGMALMEEYLPGRTENLHDYLIPTFGDAPPIESIIIESADAHGPYGAKGLGEHTLIPTAPALLNAIRRACGVRAMRIPATPSALHAALRAAASPPASPSASASQPAAAAAYSSAPSAAPSAAPAPRLAPAAPPGVRNDR